MQDEDRFRWHPEARIHGPDGRLVAPCAPVGAVISDGPEALAQALAQAGRGLAFRIGAEDQPAPAPWRVPMFETLTSGSSGQPRRIRRKQQSWRSGFAVNAGLFGIGPGRRVAVLGRLVHSLSLYGALEGACMGADVHLLAGLRPDRQRARLAALGVDILYATPAQLRLLLETGEEALPALRLVLVGGSKLDRALRAALAVVAPQADLREFYGAAETSFVTLSDAGCPPDSVGRAYPGVALSIRSAAGVVLGDGALGEVWVRSPYLCEGYAGDMAGRPLGIRGWMSVGEMGWLEQGMLHLAGRVGRMVTVADQNVFPEEIEGFLAGLAGVRRVAVLPRRDPLRGQVLVAVIMGDAAQEEAILRAARDLLGPLKAPREVIWRETWPELASGKTNLTQLQAEVGL